MERDRLCTKARRAISFFEKLEGSLGEWDVEDLLRNEHFSSLIRSQLNRQTALYRNHVFQNGGVKQWMVVHWRSDALLEIRRMLSLLTKSMLDISV